MKVTKINGGKLVNWNIKPYLIDWERKVSAPQLAVKRFLFRFWCNSIVIEEARIPGCLLRLDLCNLGRKQIIEISPDKVHLEYNKFFHNGRAGFLKKLNADFAKRTWAEEYNNFHFIELYDEDLQNLSPEYLKEKFDLDL